MSGYFFDRIQDDFIFQNSDGPVTGDIEFDFLDSDGLVRFALPKSATGNATYNPRSMIIAGPAIADRVRPPVCSLVDGLQFLRLVNAEDFVALGLTVRR